jgi:hypothetical protein
MDFNFQRMYFSVLFNVLVVVFSFSWLKADSQVPKSISDNFTVCLPLKDNISNHQFRTDGYYVMKETEAGNNRVLDTFEVNMIFFNDGTFLDNFFDFDSTYPGNTKKYLKNVYNGFGQQDFYNGFYWGAYKLTGDTVIAQVIFNRGKSFLAPWDAREYKFRVIDSVTLEFLKTEARSLAGTTKSEARALKESMRKKEFLPVRFMPYDYIPAPDCWLKKEPWIWCEK